MQLLKLEYLFIGFQSTSIKQNDDNLFSARSTVQSKFTELQSTFNL